LISLAEKLKPKHTAVVIIDMQNDFCAYNGYLHNKFGRDTTASPKLAQNIMTTVKIARKAGVMIIWIKANYELKHLGPAMKEGFDANLICCEGGSWGWDFYNVLPLTDEPVIEKHCYNGFFKTNLDEILKARNIKTLVMTGVATNVCVESTLRDAYFRGYYIVMPEDLVAASTPEFQQGTIENVRSYFGDVPKAIDIEEIWAV
jgi:ureidoacrylate peracid hydrolase